MSTSLPTPLRALLGLAALAVEEVRKIPESIPGAMTSVPVEAISAAMQASMKIQQQIAVLATKGDELISQLRGTPADAPAWATFDEDEPATDTRPVAPFDRTPYPTEQDEPAAASEDEPDEGPAEHVPAEAEDFDVSALTVEAVHSDSATTVRALADKAPAKKTPGRKAPSKKSAAMTAADGVPAAVTPAAKAPAKKAPAKTAPVKNAAAKKSAGTALDPTSAPALAEELGSGTSGPSVPAPRKGPAVPQLPVGPAVPPEA